MTRPSGRTGDPAEAATRPVSHRPEGLANGPMAVGALLAVVYTVVALGTIGGSDGRHVRPLFQGVGPSAPYHWVNPPKEFAAGNVRPRPGESRISFDENGSRSAGTGTPDAQLVINLPGGAVAPGGGDTEMLARLTPVDPATLAPVPAPLRADGNAYRVELILQPSGRPVETLAKPGNLVLIVPEPAETVLFSVDGRAWDRLPAQSVGSSGSTGTSFGRTGWYLAAAPRTAAAGGGGGAGTSQVLVVLALTGGLALSLALVPPLRRSRRQGPGRGTPSPAGRPARRGGSNKKSPNKKRPPKRPAGRGRRPGSSKKR